MNLAEEMAKMPTTEIKFLKFEMLAICVNLKALGGFNGKLTTKDKETICWKAVQPSYQAM
jgi:hypothetical protein